MAAEGTDESKEEEEDRRVSSKSEGVSFSMGDSDDGLAGSSGVI